MVWNNALKATTFFRIYCCSGLIIFIFPEYIWHQEQLLHPLYFITAFRATRRYYYAVFKNLKSVKLFMLQTLAFAQLKIYRTAYINQLSLVSPIKEVSK